MCTLPGSAPGNTEGEDLPQPCLVTLADGVRAQVAMVELLLKNGCIAAESSDLNTTLATWQKMRAGDMWSKEGALTTCAVIDRAQVPASPHPRAACVALLCAYRGAAACDGVVVERAVRERERERERREREEGGFRRSGHKPVL